MSGLMEKLGTKYFCISFIKVGFRFQGAFRVQGLMRVEMAENVVFLLFVTVLARLDVGPERLGYVLDEEFGRAFGAAHASRHY